MIRLAARLGRRGQHPCRHLTQAAHQGHQQPVEVLLLALELLPLAGASTRVVVAPGRLEESRFPETLA